MSKKCLCLLAALLVLLCPVASQAGDRKTDVVTLYNGDRITGEIKSMAGGMLELSTDAMGTLSIEWPEIARVESEYFYELRLSDGSRLYGSLQEQSTPGQLLLEDIYGKHPVEWLQVVEVRPIEDSVLERLDVYLSTTFSYTKASSIGQVTFNTDVSYEDETSLNSLTGRMDIVNSDGDKSSSARVDLTRAVWRADRGDSFRALFGSFESNEELDLGHRIGAGAGVGRYFVDTHRAQVVGIAGLQAITEDNGGGDENQEVEMILYSSFSTWKFNTPELDLQLNFSLYPSVTDLGRVRSSSNLRLRWEIVEDLYWDITAWATTDNNSETGQNSDYAVTTGVGWEY